VVTLYGKFPKLLGTPLIRYIGNLAGNQQPSSDTKLDKVQRL